jgi:hypothetical protein
MELPRILIRREATASRVNARRYALDLDLGATFTAAP